MSEKTKTPAKKTFAPLPQQMSPKSKKKKSITNTYELVQFKKMLGKGLVMPFKGVEATVNPKVKEKILSGNVKTIGMSGFVRGGVIFIFDGVDRLLAINSITYADIKKTKIDIEIIVNQYNNLTPQDLV